MMYRIFQFIISLRTDHIATTPEWVELATRRFGIIMNQTADEFEAIYRDGAFVWKRNIDAIGERYIWNKIFSVTTVDRHGNRSDSSRGKSYRAIVNMVIPESAISLNNAGVSLEIVNPDTGEICEPCFTISDRVDGLTLTIWKRDGLSLFHQRSEPAHNLAHGPGASVRLEIQYIRSSHGEAAQMIFFCNGRRLNWELPMFAGPNTTVTPSMMVAGSGEFRFLSMAVYL